MNSDTDNRLRKHIGHACLQWPCPDLDASLRFFTERLGFVVEQIVPADAPRTALLSGHGMNLRLRAERAARPAQNRICIQLRSEEHTSELQSLMRISYDVFCLKKTKTETTTKAT